MESEVLKLSLRAGILYVVALIVFRGMGKRTLGKMGAFDFAVIIMMGEALALGMEDVKTPITNSIAIVVALGLLQFVLTWLNTRWRFLEEISQGHATVVAKNGRINQKAMNRERLSQADLMMELRNKGVTRLSQVKTATLEPTGDISVESASSSANSSQGGNSSSSSASSAKSDPKNTK